MKASPSLPSLIQRALSSRGYAQQSSARLLRSQVTFLSQVVGPHFEAVCRDWARSSGAQVFGTVPGDVVAGVVPDPLRRSQIQVDAAVFAPDEPGRPRRVLSLGCGQVGQGHESRSPRAAAPGPRPLAVKEYDTEQTRLTCYSGARFDSELVDRAAGDPTIQLIGLEELYD